MLTPYLGTAATLFLAVHDIEALTIGEAARRAAVNVETVRFYEREGLLARPARPARPARLAKGFRHYPAGFADSCRGGGEVDECGVLASLSGHEAPAHGRTRGRVA